MPVVPYTNRLERAEDAVIWRFIDLRKFRDLMASEELYLWSRGVTRWFRLSLSVADPFVCRCLTNSAMLPFPHPAHRTGRADLPHPALGEDSRNCRSQCM